MRDKEVKGKAGSEVQRARDPHAVESFLLNLTKFRNKFEPQKLHFHTQRHIANARTLTVNIFSVYMIFFLPWLHLYLSF